METIFFEDILYTHIWFKSYYVVWKPINRGSFEISVSLFKSYYVVWKLTGQRCENVRDCCLNRTMQYGNRSSFASCNCLTPSLNRTMQYGNCVQIVVIVTFIQFKSYYVVWKRVKKGTKKPVCVGFKSYYVVWKRKAETQRTTTDRV